MRESDLRSARADLEAARDASGELQTLPHVSCSVSTSVLARASNPGSTDGRVCSTGQTAAALTAQLEASKAELATLVARLNDARFVGSSTCLPPLTVPPSACCTAPVKPLDFEHDGAGGAAGRGWAPWRPRGIVHGLRRLPRRAAWRPCRRRLVS